MARSSARESILDCAEQLFAERGVAAVSLRAINSGAGLSPAALHYHFGTRDGLVEALLERRMDGLMARRAELLDRLEASDSPDARGVMDAIVRPMVELLATEGEAGRRYVRLLARLQADGAMPEGFVVSRFRSGVDRLEPLLRRTLPDLPRPVLQLRLALAVDLVPRTLSTWEALGGTVRSAAPQGLDAFVEALLDFVVGALEAPSSSTPNTRSARSGRKKSQGGR